MRRHTSWNGTTDEALLLLRAIQAHCACQREADRVLTVCPSHAMLAHDQRAIDGLLFMRRMAQRLLREEFAGSLMPPADSLLVQWASATSRESSAIRT